MGFFLEKMFNYKIVKYSLLQESYVIQHKKVVKIFGAKRENALTLQPQKRKRGTPRGTFAKFIEGIEEASVVQENKRERSQFGQVTLRRYNKEKEKIQRRV